MTSVSAIKPAAAAKAAGQRTLPKVTGRDREFYPPALEILETPPAPLAVTFMLAICAFAAAALAWACIGQLDVHAAAPGKVETEGRSKVIQPLDPGRVAAIHVDVGSRISAGQLLLEFDPAEAVADVNSASSQLNAALSEAIRRRFAIDTVRAAAVRLQSAPEHDGQTSADLETAISGTGRGIAWDDSIPDVYRTRETAILAADLSQLADAVRSLDKQMVQKEATRERLNMSIGFQNTLLETLEQRVDTRQESLDRQVGAKTNLYDAKEELEKSQSALASDRGELLETQAGIEVLQSDKAKTLAQFISDYENRLADAVRRSDEARQTLAKASARLSRTKLYAPIGGIVQVMAVTTVGQVVTTGQQLIVITPDDGTLRVQALVANTDIGFIKVGQDASVKIDAFPFTRFGVLHGKVISIASEAVDEQSAKRTLADATASASGGPAASAPGQPQNFVFPVTVALDQNAIKIGDTSVPLTPGMTATVEIKTDTRRVIDYLLSPLTKIASEAMTER